MALAAEMTAKCEALSWRGVRVRTWLFSQRVRPALILLAGITLMFGLQRAVLAWQYRADLVDVTLGSLTQAFVVGLRYDLRALAYVLIPVAPLLCLAPEATFSRRWLQALLAGYVAAVLTLTAAVCIVDALFFLYETARMNCHVTNYFAQGEVVEYLWEHYPIIKLALLVAVILACAYRLTMRLCRAATVPIGSALARLAYVAALAGGIFLCASGPASRPALDSSLASFSSNNVVSELSLNPGVTLAAAVKDFCTESEDEPLHYLPLLSEPQALTVAKETLRQDHTEFVNDAPAGQNPLWRTVRTGRARRDLNVVVIVMESFAGKGVGAMGYMPSQTPFFDELASKGLFCSKMYATGPRTARGLTAVTCGFPNIGGESMLSRSSTQGAFLTLFSVFAQRGYQTMFVHGGNARFDNMRHFFCSNGLQRLVDLADMPAGQWRTNWGVADHVMFEQADREFRRAGNKPFFAMLLTLTNHSPYRIPPGCIDPVPGDSDEVKMVNTLRYADWALQRFFQLAAKSEYFKNTLFVLVADHGRNLDHRLLVDVPGYRVPCLFYAPSMPELTSRVISDTCSQTDVAATLMSLLGGTFSHCMFSRDLLATSPADPGIAMLWVNRRIALVSGRSTLIIRPDGEPALFHLGLDDRMVELPGGVGDDQLAEIMRHKAMALYQSAYSIFRSQTYVLPPRS
ncbi:MAG: sulfatase-like hydrolase/transferase [Planctomycetes bacterium]|nr:sulfatase-like hydrolase/transferase [Planctomycetota bacterium]